MTVIAVSTVNFSQGQVWYKVRVVNILHVLTICKYYLCVCRPPIDSNILVLYEPWLSLFPRLLLLFSLSTRHSFSTVFRSIIVTSPPFFKNVPSSSCFQISPLLHQNSFFHHHLRFLYRWERRKWPPKWWSFRKPSPLTKAWPWAPHRRSRHIHIPSKLLQYNKPALGAVNKRLSDRRGVQGVSAASECTANQSLCTYAASPSAFPRFRYIWRTLKWGWHRICSVYRLGSSF